MFQLNFDESPLLQVVISSWLEIRLSEVLLFCIVVPLHFFINLKKRVFFLHHKGKPMKFYKSFTTFGLAAWC